MCLLAYLLPEGAGEGGAGGGVHLGNSSHINPTLGVVGGGRNCPFDCIIIPDQSVLRFVPFMYQLF